MMTILVTNFCGLVFFIFTHQCLLMSIFIQFLWEEEKKTRSKIRTNRKFDKNYQCVNNKYKYKS